MLVLRIGTPACEVGYLFGRTVRLGVNYPQTSYGESQDLQQAESGEGDISARHHDLLGGLRGGGGYVENFQFKLEGGIGT